MQRPVKTALGFGLALSALILGPLAISIVARDAVFELTVREDEAMPVTSVDLLPPPQLFGPDLWRCIFPPRSPVLRLLKQHFPAATASRWTDPYDAHTWTYAEIDVERKTADLKGLKIDHSIPNAQRPFAPCGRQLVVTLKPAMEGVTLHFEFVERDLW
jgi:hypothetical protein